MENSSQTNFALAFSLSSSGIEIVCNNLPFFVLMEEYPSKAMGHEFFMNS